MDPDTRAVVLKAHSMDLRKQGANALFRQGEHARAIERAALRHRRRKRRLLSFGAKMASKSNSIITFDFGKNVPKMGSGSPPVPCGASTRSIPLVDFTLPTRRHLASTSISARGGSYNTVHPSTIKYPSCGGRPRQVAGKHANQWINTSPPRGERGVLRVRAPLRFFLFACGSVWVLEPRPHSPLGFARDISAPPSAFGKGSLKRAAYP